MKTDDSHTNIRHVALAVPKFPAYRQHACLSGSTPEGHPHSAPLEAAHLFMNNCLGNQGFTHTLPPASIYLPMDSELLGPQEKLEPIVSKYHRRLEDLTCQRAAVKEHPQGLWLSFPKHDQSRQKGKANVLRSGWTFIKYPQWERILTACLVALGRQAFRSSFSWLHGTKAV